jgi:hypothetical protein
MGFVFPAGGRQGSTFEVKIGGEYFDGATSLHISGEGVEGKILGQTRPLTQREIAALRAKLQELEEKKEKTDDDRKEIENIRKQLAPPAVQPTPALAEIVTAEITIDPRATPGQRQLRLRGNTGMSNPVAFFVGQIPEVTVKRDLINPEAPRTRPPDTEVTLPAAINGQIMPGAVDRYRFPARKGQQLVFITRARGLIPYLADAVPGWFEAGLTLYDSGGNEVAASESFRHHPDPVLAYQVPRDGEYVLAIQDGLYRGREDFVYRIEAGELPFVTGIFPLGGKAGASATVALEGWNLPESSLTLEPSDTKPGTLPLSVRSGELLSGPRPFEVDTLPECLEQEGNHSPATAQKLALPVVVNGRVDQPGQWDVFRFEGLVGQTVVAEVRARRLESPLDSVLRLTDAGGKVLASNDDTEDRGQGLITHHADSQLRATLPASGTYYLHLGDAQGQGSPAHAYRLRVSGPRPDFELRVTPCSINARPGSTVVLSVTALRKDGFAGDISLFLTYTPVDFALEGAKIPAGQDEVRVTLHVPTTERPRPIDLVMEGRAAINGRRVVRIATPAEDMMQAFIWHHLVPVNKLMVTVSGQARARYPARLLTSGPARIVAGGTAVVRIAIPRARAGNAIEFALSDPPEGITLKESQMTDDGAILLLHADGEKVKPGLRGNLIVEVYRQAAAKPGAAPTRAGQPLGTLPAIPFEVLKLGR